jgi:hypothetical protein
VGWKKAFLKTVLKKRGVMKNKILGLLQKQTLAIPQR